MGEFYVVPAHVIENVQPVEAESKKRAAEIAGERDGVTAGRVAVIPAESVGFKTLEMTTSLEAVDEP